MRNLLLTIEYDGTAFSGWQRQPGRRTVQGELERVLSILCAQEITIDGTGRTDAGVHALGQCATFSGEFGIPVQRLMTAANDLLAKNRMMGGDVRITSVQEVPDGFHARFSAKGKRYIYKIVCAPMIPVFYRNYVYHVRTQLDTEAMARALKAFEGTHDFAGFMAAGSNLRGSTVRTIYEADLFVRERIRRSTACELSGAQSSDAVILRGEKNLFRSAARGDAGIGGTGMPWKTLSGQEEQNGCELEISLKGDGFLYNMVRIIAGTLVDVGTGRIRGEDMPDIICSRDRSRAGHTAPPQGLYMAEVYFQEIRYDGQSEKQTGLG